MDLVPVIAPEHHVEFPCRGVFKEIVELGVDVGLHEARSCCRDGYNGRTGGRTYPRREAVGFHVRWYASVLR
ncbi:hypothetical protein TBS_23400 [Thermobispora bispora]